MTSPRQSVAADTCLAAADASPIGRLGRYRLRKSLGVGGQAEVFKADYSAPGGFERTVVVKRILPSNCADPDFVRMFAAEARILGMLHHPNVVQAYDVGESDGTLFLVLEYVDGPSLGRLLRALRTARRPLPLAIAAYFARELCRALDYVHNLRNSDGQSLNVIHRDVTPSNVVLTSAGSLKLLDFGIAKYDSSDVHTRQQIVKGKPAYLAPEAIEGRPFDGRVDLFSVGVILHEMLTLTPLFRAEHDLAILHKVLEMPIAPPSDSRPEIPASLDAIVMRALERDPDRRYATAAQMARDLDDFVVGAHLRVENVVHFLREVEPLLNQPCPPLAALAETSITSRDGAPAAPPAKPKLMTRLRQGRLGRLLFGSAARTVTGIVLALSLGFVAASARADGAPPQQPVPLGAGVTLSIAPFKRPRSTATELVPLPVTISNQGPDTIRLRYRHFLLTDGAGQKSMALLPSELQFEKTSARPLPEGTLASGKTSSGSLYFHLPSTFVPPIGLRVDLESADGAVLGQTIVPL